MCLFHLVAPTYTTLQTEELPGRIATVLDSQIKCARAQVPAEPIPPKAKKEIASVWGKCGKQSNILLVSKPDWCSIK